MSDYATWSNRSNEAVDSKMTKDARISTGLPGHPKTKKLLRRLGHAGPLACIYLFIWSAANRSDGDLSGLSNEDIELSVDWTGEHGAFVSAMVDVGFLDGAENQLSIHDWSEHNPWAAGAKDRSEASRFAALCKRYGRNEAAVRMPDYADRMRGAHGPHTDRMRGGCEADAPSPSPSPSPSPIPLPDINTITSPDKLATCPTEKIVQLYNQTLHQLPSVKLMTDKRKKAIGKFWRFVLTSKKSDGKPRAGNSEQALDWIEAYFLRVLENDFLMGKTGRTGEHSKWQCDLDYLLTDKGMTQVIEKTRSVD